MIGSGWRTRLADARARRAALRGDLAGALEHFRRAAELDPDGMSRWTAATVSVDSKSEWQRALRLPGFEDLRASLACEAAEYFSLSEEEARAALEAPLPAEWAQDRYDAADVRELFARDRAFLFANLRVAATDKHLACRSLAADVFARAGAKRVLDYGSGVGNMAVYFSRRGIPEVACADVSKPILELGTWRFERRGLAKPESYVLGESSLPEASFDGISILDVFEVAPEVEAILDESRSALRAGGRLVLSVGSACASAERRWLVGRPSADVLAAAAVRFGGPLEIHRVRHRVVCVFAADGQVP